MMLALLLLACAALAQTSTLGAPEPETTQPSAVLGPPEQTIDTVFRPHGQDVTVTGMLQDDLGIFLGIPFAEPPVGDLRFRRPQPASAATLGDHITATQRPPACMQARGSVAANVSGISEDCLFVNVITPAAALGEDCELKDLPVLVWIYGGGYYGGSAVLYTSPSLAGHALRSGKPVVLVTLGYRVGIWGFGATNLGLHDQLLALRWVREHIGAFGGDPAKVTLFGESAGAMSVNILMFNATQDLFRGAIMQSGSASSLPGYGEDPAIYQAPYDRLTEFAGCNGTGSFECLRKLPAEALLAAQDQMIGSQTAYTWGYPFGPALDGELIPASPYHLTKNGSFSKVPFIAGANRDEGTTFLWPSVLNEQLTQWPLSTAIEMFYPSPLPSEFYDKIEAFYPRNGSGCPFGSGGDLFNGSVTPAWKQVTAVLTDLMMQARRRWLLRAANAHGHTQTWSYEFVANNPSDPAYWGSGHEAEKPYVFGRAVPELGYSPAQIQLGERMMDYWVNFAYCLEPNGACCDKGRGNRYDKRGREKPWNGHDDDHDEEGKHGGKGKHGGELPHWPAHAWPANKNSLQLDAGAVQVIQDDFREAPIALFNAPENAYFARRRRAL